MKVYSSETGVLVGELDGHFQLQHVYDPTFGAFWVEKDLDDGIPGFGPPPTPPRPGIFVDVETRSPASFVSLKRYLSDFEYRLEL